MEIRRVAIDTSKHVCTLHGVDERDHPVLRRELKRTQVEPFFSKLRPTEVVLEACGGSWSVEAAPFSWTVMDLGDYGSLCNFSS